MPGTASACSATTGIARVFACRLWLGLSLRRSVPASTSTSSGALRAAQSCVTTLPSTRPWTTATTCRRCRWPGHTAAPQLVGPAESGETRAIVVVILTAIVVHCLVPLLLLLLRGSIRVPLFVPESAVSLRLSSDAIVSQNRVVCLAVIGHKRFRVVVLVVVIVVVLVAGLERGRSAHYKVHCRRCGFSFGMRRRNCCLGPFLGDGCISVDAVIGIAPTGERSIEDLQCHRERADTGPVGSSVPFVIFQQCRQRCFDVALVAGQGSFDKPFSQVRKYLPDLINAAAQLPLRSVRGEGLVVRLGGRRRGVQQRTAPPDNPIFGIGRLQQPKGVVSLRDVVVSTIVIVSKVVEYKMRPPLVVAFVLPHGKVPPRRRRRPPVNIIVASPRSCGVHNPEQVLGR